jgi:hypothetical protein
MIIARKEFQHPNGREVEEEQEYTEGFWKPVKKTVKVKVWKSYNFSEVIEQVMEFVNSLEKGNLINVCEYTTALHRIGDDGRNHFVVWYWKDVDQG